MKLTGHISFSQINAYLNCPARYMMRYVKKLVIPPPSAMIFGSATHKSIKANNQVKKDTHENEKLSVLTDIFEATILNEPEIQMKEGETKGDMIDEGCKKIIPLYYTELAPNCQPIMVEEKFEVSFPNVEWTFQGIVDLVDEKENIVDYKTTGKTPSVKAGLIPDPQLTGYSLGYRNKTGHLPNKTYLNYLIRTKEPKTFISAEGGRTIKDLEVFLKLVAWVVNSIEQEIWTPNINNYSCNKQNCGYFPHCKKEFFE